MEVSQRLSTYGISSLRIILFPVYILIFLNAATQHVETGYTNCSETNNQEIKSPFYPDFYPNNAACKWHIPITSDEIATISFLDFIVVRTKDCKGDYLSISPNDVKYCGSTLPPTYFSEEVTQTIIITFRSDRANRQKGFHLKYYVGDRFTFSCDPIKQFRCSIGNCLPLECKCNGKLECSDGSDESHEDCHQVTTQVAMTTVPLQCHPHQIPCQSADTFKPICLPESKKCDGHKDCADEKDENSCITVCHHDLKGSFGNFTSPNFPNLYDANLDCVWILSVSDGEIIQLRFYVFNLESVENADYVTVYDGADALEITRIGTYYSYNNNIHVPPKVIEGTGNQLRVTLRTDSLLNSIGFNATYQTKGQCILNQHLCSSKDKNCYDASQQCDHYLTCIKGQDELECAGCRKNEIHCYRSTKGCFTMEQRCNGKVNCPQGEDEEGCDETVCNADLGLFLCSDKMCMEEKYICDSSSDCVDGSDEMNCYVSTNVITAAAVGSIVCGLLLVAALSCTCKLYQLHVRDRFPPSHMSPMREIEEELLRREAPPSYTATMASPHFDEAQRAFIEGIQAAVIARNESRSSSRQNGDRRQRGTFVRMLSRDRNVRTDSQTQIQQDENTAESQTEMPPPSPAEVENEFDSTSQQEEINRVENGPPPLRRISGDHGTPTVSPSPVEAFPESDGIQMEESASSSVSDTDSETNQDALDLAERNHQILRAAANIRRMRLAGGLQNVMQAQDHRAARARSRTGSQADIANPTTAESAPTGDSAPTSDGETETVAAVGSPLHLNKNTNNTSDRTETESWSLPPQPTQVVLDMPEFSQDLPRHQRDEPELELDSENLQQVEDVEAQLDTRSPDAAAACDDKEIENPNEDERLSQASSILSLVSAGSVAMEGEDVAMVEP